MLDQPLVVITGLSGFIAKHIAVEVLNRGYRVRGTLRSLGVADSVRAALVRGGADIANLTVAEADLTSDGGWEEVVRDATYVLHTASPFPMQQPENADDVIAPARDGTLRVLRAATKASVKRAVITSSTVAIFYSGSNKPEQTYTEENFTDETLATLTPYIRSKTIAEKAAWDFVRATPGAPELVAINPGFVQGPALDADLSTSHDLFRLMAKGIYPAAPKIRFPVAHVRDVAIAHAEALRRPQAAHQRYLIANGSNGLYGFGQIMAETLPDLASKVPKFELPDFAVRALALTDKRMRTILPELGQHKAFSNAKAAAELGINFTAADTAVRQSVQSLRALGLI